jgi:hypothetical protein
LKDNDYCHQEHEEEAIEEVTKGKLIGPLNVYKDEVLIRMDHEDMATFHNGGQGELEDVTEHVELEFSKVVGKRPTDVAKLKTP